jgi:YVTN family beta-propeller protein
VQVEFRILGPVEIRDGERILISGTGKPVALLAILLLHANEVVSSERLIDELWGDRPPRTAAKALQTYVSQLRRALGGDALVTRSRGYLLLVAFGELDAQRFEQLAASGREAFARGDAAAAAASLSEGLSLWRGPALADVAHEDWARAHVERLEEARLQALEARLEADLALGRHADVAGELEGLAHEHPLRERLLALRMLALYRCGRQAPALEAYRVGRRRLIDELGMEPGPELRGLERQILEQDATLLGPPVRRLPASVAARSRLPLAGGVAVALAVAAAAWFALADGSNSSPHLAAANSAALVDPHGRLKLQIGVGATPAHAIWAYGFLWTSNEHDATVSRVDPSARSVETIAVGRSPEGLAYASNEVWVADGGDAKLDAIDPRSGKVVRSVAVGNGPVGVAARRHEVWVTNSVDGTLSTIDARTGRRIRTVPIGSDPVAVAAAPGAVWVTLAGSGAVVELDRDGRVVLQMVNVGNDPSALAVRGDRVWVANTGDGTLSRIDVTRGLEDLVIPLGGSPTTVAVGEAAVLVGLSNGRLVQVDPRSGRVVQTSEVGGGSAAVVAVGQNAWVTTLAAPTSHRGGTLRVETDELSECGCLDPLAPVTPDGLRFADLVYDGLVAYRRVGGPAGGVLVPDLARAIPKPVDGDSTYVFQLRRGVRFSNGRLVRASDVRASFVRFFKVDHVDLFPLYSRIAGAASCTDGGRCDLSRGILADDRTGTVTFHLSAPDPNFLYTLALPLAATVPADSPMTIARRPLAGTGPYEIAAYSHGHLVLTRNPRFRVFAPEARPDGYPARIVATLGIPVGSQIKAVQGRKSDVVTSLANLPALLVARLAIRDPSQLHADPSGATDYMFLNTRVPPFNRLAARRAVNDAADREHLVRLSGGPEAATPTCQILPPGLPGYHPFCPYGLEPSAAGTWVSPSLAKAQQLVTASGTRGARVTVWAPADHAVVATYFASLLRQIGYLASARIVAEPTTHYYDEVGNPRARAQIGWVGWIKDYTAPTDFIRPLFSCAGIVPAHPEATSNYSQLCDRSLDRQIAAAGLLQQQDVTAGDRAWAALDRTIVDRAAAVPYANPLTMTLLSRRTGNYQFNPEWGVLLDQLWVR